MLFYSEGDIDLFHSSKTVITYPKFHRMSTILPSWPGFLKKKKNIYIIYKIVYDMHLKPLHIKP